ncbi:MAG: NCS2 family permease [FCB group bacterium]|nr:NCS2 family permease [FCB group bacterium]
MLNKLFKIKENDTTIRTEIRAGATTFLTMAYIIFFQPALLAQAGMDFGSVMMATCISAALATFVMGLWANYPIALAPGMGENFFFAFTVVIAMGTPWQTALGIVFISGIIFLLLTVFRVRQMIIEAVPPSLKSAIVVGIGIFIAFIGLSDAGIVVRNNAGLAPIAFMEQGDLSTADFLLQKFQAFEYASGAVKLGDLTHPAPAISLFGLVLISVLMVRRVKGAILWGILAALALALITGGVEWKGLAGTPPSISPTLFKLDIAGALTLKMLPIVIVVLFMDVLDTIGAFIGVTQQANLLKNGRMVRAQQALYADSIGTMAGALLGTSTVTSYIESAAGVEAGGRTGLTAVTTGFLFLTAIFFYPLVQMVGGGFDLGDNLKLYPITAPALIIVGAMMARNVVKIDWLDYSEAIPAFLVMLGMPLTYSISDGLAFGFISYPVIKLLSGRWKECSWLVYLLGLLFTLRYLFL